MRDQADQKQAIIVGADADPEVVRVLRDAGYTVDAAVTDRKKREDELHRLNRTLKAHNNSSHAMMRAVDEQEYLREVCRIVVEDCGHAMVWIGYAGDDEDKSVRPVAYSGFDEGYLETLKVTWADTERGRGPTGTSIRTGKPSTCRNMLTDPKFEPWREQALKRGYASSIALPLIANNAVLGALTIYAREPDPFSEDEVSLLAGLANDLAYGIAAIRLREERARAEEELVEARADAERRASQLESFISSMVDGVMLFDSAPKVLMVNDALKRLLGAPPGVPFETYMKMYELRALDGEPLALEDYPSRRALRGEETEAARFRIATLWRESVVSISGSPVTNEHGLVVGGTLSFHDITDLVDLEEYKDELYRREHHIAEVLQQALIPPEVPTEIRGFQIGVKYQPALSESEVGGDFYDVFDLGNGKIGVMIGDVAGKGLSAAIRVAAARYSVRSYAFIDPRPSHVMTLANEALCKDSSDESAILTVFFAVINTATGRVTYASAGHEPPVVCRASGIIQELRLGGLPFGVKESSTYDEDVLDLAPGDTIVLVTDGITEARGGSRALFEKRGMVQYLADNMDASPDKTASGLLEAAKAHAGGQLQDDAAIVVVMLETRQPVR